VSVPFDITDPVVDELGPGISSPVISTANAPDGLRWDCFMAAKTWLKDASCPLGKW
jgi:hypothetical protein